MADISIYNLPVKNNDSILVPLDRANNELVKEAIKRALNVRGGLAVSGINPHQTDGMFPRDRDNGSSF